MLIKRAKFILVVAVIAVSAVIVSACQGASAQNVPGPVAKSTQAASVPTSASPAPSGTATTPVKYIGEFSINPSHAPIGATVSAAGKGFESEYGTGA